MKKIVSVVVIVSALCAALLAVSCKKAGSTGGQDLSNLNAVGTYPIAKKTESFTLLVDDSWKIEDKILLKKFNEETNIHPDILLFPYAAAVEQKNIKISTGDYPDVIAGWILGDNDILQLGMGEGVFIPLEDLIEQYAPNIKEALALPGVRAAMTLPDGHIYSPPYPIGGPILTFAPWINKKWLAQVGMEMPKTTDELKAVLIAFRDKIKLPNGLKVIPFSGDPVNMNLGTFAGWWGVPAPNQDRNAGGFAMINGQPTITVTTDAYKSMIKYFADLYKEGLIDPEIFTQDQDMWRSKGKQNIYGVNMAYYPPDFQIDPSPAEPWIDRFDYTVLPPLSAPGTKTVWRRNAPGNPGEGTNLYRTQFAITNKAKNPVTIIRWLDYIYDKVHSAEAGRGQLGIMVEEGPDGYMHEVDRTGLPELPEWEGGRFWIGSLPKFYRGGKVFPPLSGQPAFDYERLAENAYASVLETEMMPDLWLPADVASRSAIITNDVNTYINRKMAEWISGQANVDAEWDAYKAQLDTLGIQELLQLKKTAMGR